MKLDPTNVFEPAFPAESNRAKFANRVRGWNARHPILAILLVSLVAVVINCYPVIFCGKSYVSPACARWLVYDWWPPLPGAGHTPYQYDPAHGSDTGAMMWWGVPLGFVESRSLLEQGELPLWNRYGHAGDTLIGQAVSMLGDPLQGIVILGRGSAEAWDVKYVVAKFLFSAGFGLLILRLFGSRPMSLIYAALAAYCGVYFFIYNHPVFFVFAYAPWILLSALAWFDGPSRRWAGWGPAWLLANFACFNAGHVETAVILIGGLNLAAVIHALVRGHNLADRAKVIARAGAGTLLFLGLTAPVWISFLAALSDAYTLHSEVHVVQLPWVTLPGVFDDLFFLLPVDLNYYAAVTPGTSLLVMTGCILSVLRWRQLKRETFFWLNLSAILVWGGCVFGWMPRPVLEAVPFLNRVGHTFNDFSYLLAIHLILQSAGGFLSLARENSFGRAAAQLLGVALVFGGMVLAYDLGIPHRPMPWDYFICGLAGAIGAPLLFVHLNSGHRPLPLVGWAGIVILGFIPHFRFGLYNFGSDDLLMRPGPRAVLNAPSESIGRLQQAATGPFRVAGMGWNLVGDYSAVYGLEDIRSCAPLSRGDYLDLVTNFPGMKFGAEGGWGIGVDSPVAAQPLLNLLNVQYLLANPGNQVVIEKGAGFRVADRGDFLVLENLDAWPRAYFTDKIAVNASTMEFIGQLQKQAREPFASLGADEIARTAGLRLLEETRQPVVVPATKYRLGQNSTAFDIHAPSAGVVCLLEGQAKDFTVKANGETKAVLTVNRVFKGMYLDQPGDYHIEFVYRPRHWRLSCACFWISAGCAMVVAAFNILRARSKRNADATELTHTA
jgi:hypothetical protein